MPRGAVTLQEVNANDAIRGSLIVAAAGLLGVAGWRLSRAPPPSREALDLLTLVDQDGDGVINAAEYARVGDGELPLPVVDANGSGVLEPWEVDLLIRHVSPLRPSMSWIPRAL